jgi:hypothetical protein
MLHVLVCHSKVVIDKCLSILRLPWIYRIHEVVVVVTQVHVVEVHASADSLAQNLLLLWKTELIWVQCLEHLLFDFLLAFALTRVVLAV